MANLQGAEITDSVANPNAGGFELLPPTPSANGRRRRPPMVWEEARVKSEFL